MQPESTASSEEAGIDVAARNLDWLEQSSLDLLDQVLNRAVAGRTAIVSSFGAESAILLHLAAQVRRDAPVLFVDTQMMFQETLDYQQELAGHLGLTDVRRITAEFEAIRREDVFGRLHLKDPDRCCEIRKVIPLDAALEGYHSWITGRKRQQSATRASLAPFEQDDSGRIKINPLLHWTRDDIEAAFERHDLPRHPLVAEGFTSIGCAPCTRAVAPGADPRSGRWAGRDKTECGIHIVGGRVERAAG